MKVELKGYPAHLRTVISPETNDEKELLKFLTGFQSVLKPKFDGFGSLIGYEIHHNGT